jgi:hypothetical protein
VEQHKTYFSEYAVRGFQGFSKWSPRGLHPVGFSSDKRPTRKISLPRFLYLLVNDKMSNDLWKATGQEDWIGHKLRKENWETSKAASQWKPQESRKRGRQKNICRRSVIKVAGRSWNELRFLAADKSEKRMVDNLCSH